MPRGGQRGPACRTGGPRALGLHVQGLDLAGRVRHGPWKENQDKNEEWEILLEWIKFPLWVGVAHDKSRL